MPCHFFLVAVLFHSVSLKLLDKLGLESVRLQNLCFVVACVRFGRTEAHSVRYVHTTCGIDFWPNVEQPQ